MLFWFVLIALGPPRCMFNCKFVVHIKFLCLFYKYVKHNLCFIYCHLIYLNCITNTD
jgi:hypothetical protein